MLISRAPAIAARRRGLAAASGRPERAATVISRITLANWRARRASCAPLRCMMFLNWECPAIVGCSLSDGPAVAMLELVSRTAGTGGIARRVGHAGLVHVGRLADLLQHRLAMAFQHHGGGRCRHEAC